jgi:uncharacterized protein YprB with RNaseH-like and TPR domain
MIDIDHMKTVYEKHKFSAYCIDVEWARDGKITLIGFFRPKNGPVDSYIGLVRGKDLTAENIKDVLKDSKLLITFNGTESDIPAIQKEFPDVLPHVPHLDLRYVADAINKKFGLKTLEQHYGIYRRREVEDMRHVAQKLWRKYEQKKNAKALELLLMYNREDTINLYMLAEVMMKEVS